MEFDTTGLNAPEIVMSNEVHIGNAAAALITFRNDTRTDIGKSKVIQISNNKSYKIKNWGSDNLLPNRRELTLMDNNIVGSVMTAKRDIILGAGLKPYIEIITGEGSKSKREKIPVLMTTEEEDWLESSQFYSEYLEPACESLIKHGNVFAAMMFDAKEANKHISDIKSYDCKYIRGIVKNKGFLHHENWAKTNDKNLSYTYIPTYNQDIEKLSIYHTGDRFFNDGIYFHPTYWGGSEWIELANVIPKFHKSNMKNGYVLRYHIEIPADYFLNTTKYQKVKSNSIKAKKCIDRAKAKKQKFINDLNQILAGHDNAGRTITSSKKFDALSKEYIGITITPITVDLQDEKLLKLFTASNQANISAQGIHPTLANIESQGKLSSGSEMRNALNFYTAVKTTVPRRQLLEPWNIVLKRNNMIRKKDGKYTVKWHIEDTVLSKLDEDKSGTTKPKVGSE